MCHPWHASVTELLFVGDRGAMVYLRAVQKPRVGIETVGWLRSENFEKITLKALLLAGLNMGVLIRFFLDY